MTEDREPMSEGTLDPINIATLELAEVRAANDDKVRWSGAFFAYGGAGSSQSATIYFAIAPGERLGGHTDTTEETQFIAGGEWRAGPRGRHPPGGDRRCGRAARGDLARPGQHGDGGAGSGRLLRRASGEPTLGRSDAPLQ